MKDFVKQMEKVFRAIDEAVEMVETNPNVEEYLAETYGTEYDEKVWNVIKYIEDYYRD